MPPPCKRCPDPSEMTPAEARCCGVALPLMLPGQCKCPGSSDDAFYWTDAMQRVGRLCSSLLQEGAARVRKVLDTFTGDRCALCQPDTNDGRTGLTRDGSLQTKTYPMELASSPLVVQ